MTSFRLRLPRTELMVRMHDSASTVNLKKKKETSHLYYS
jgi:hypothetical protein